MTKPEKDQVLDASADAANPGAGSNPPSSEPGAKTPTAAGPSGSAAAPRSAAEAEAVTAEVIEPEVVDPAESDVAGIDTDALAAAAAEALNAAQAEAAEWQDKYLRLHAEWDTYRRRTAEQREAEKKRAAEKLVTNLLAIVDDFERTIEFAAKNGETGLLGGVQAVHSKLFDVLSKEGVQAIDPKGEAFDSMEAQAVSTVDDASMPDETVVDVFQKGYRLGDKVLRPAMVTVSTGGPQREKPTE